MFLKSSTYKMKSSTNVLILVFISFCLLHFIRYYNYIDLDPTISGRINKIIILLVIILILINRNYFLSNSFKRNAISRKYVLWFGIFPLISSIPCFFLRGQSFTDSFNVVYVYLIIFLYFVLHKYDVNTGFLIKLFLALAIIRVLIMLIQQFTYPFYIFGGVKEGDDSLYGVEYAVQVRSGMYRFWLNSSFLQVIAGLYSINKFLRSNKIIYLFIFLLCCVGLYMDQSRSQLIYFALSVLYLLFITKYKNKLLIFFLIGIFIVLISINYNSLFGDLSKLTVSNVNEKENYIRILAYKFYLFDYWKGPLTWFLGNGVPNATSAYGHEIIKIQTQHILFTYDIGIIGSLNVYGLIFILVFIFYLYKIIFKYWKYLDPFLKVFLIFTILYSPLYFPIHYQSGEDISWAIIFYLIDKSIQISKQKMKSYNLTINNNKK